MSTDMRASFGASSSGRGIRRMNSVSMDTTVRSYADVKMAVGLILAVFLTLGGAVLVAVGVRSGPR